MKYTKQQRERHESKGAHEPEAGKWDTWEHSEEAFGWSISFPYTPNQTRPVEYVFNQVAIESMRDDYEEDSDDDIEDD